MQDLLRNECSVLPLHAECFCVAPLFSAIDSEATEDSFRDLVCVRKRNQVH